MRLTSELYLYFQQKLKNKFMQKTVLRKITLKIIFMSFVARVTYYVKFFREIWLLRTRSFSPKYLQFEASDSK